MAGENLDLVQGMCEAFVAGDFGKALDGLSPDVEWHGTIRGLDEGQTHHGLTEVVQGFTDNLQAWERHSLETQRFIDAGDQIVVFWHETGRGKASGVEVETDTAVIYTVQDAKVVKVQGYVDRNQALETLGLKE